MAIPPTGTNYTNEIPKVEAKHIPPKSSRFPNLSNRVKIAAVVAIGLLALIWAKLGSYICPLFGRVSKSDPNDTEAEERTPLLRGAEDSAAANQEEVVDEEVDESSTTGSDSSITGRDNEYVIVDREPRAIAAKLRREMNVAEDERKKIAPENEQEMIEAENERATIAIVERAFPRQQISIERFGGLAGAQNQLRADLVRKNEVYICGNRIDTLENFTDALDTTPFANCQIQLAELLSQATFSGPQAFVNNLLFDKFNSISSPEKKEVFPVFEQSYSVYKVEFYPVTDDPSSPWCIRGKMNFALAGISDGFRRSDERVLLAPHLTTQFSVVIDQERANQEIWEDLSFKYTAHLNTPTLMARLWQKIFPNATKSI